MSDAETVVEVPARLLSFLALDGLDELGSKHKDPETDEEYDPRLLSSRRRTPSRGAATSRLRCAR